MIDTDMAEQILQGDDTHPDVLQALGLEMLTEVKRLREQLAKANKYVHGICQHSDTMMMDYEDYMKGDEEE